MSDEGGGAPPEVIGWLHWWPLTKPIPPGWVPCWDDTTDDHHHRNGYGAIKTDSEEAVKALMEASGEP